MCPHRPHTYESPERINRILQAMMDEELSRHLDALVLAGAEFPSDLKKHLTLRRASQVDLGPTSGLAGAEKCLHIMVPWASPEDGSEDQFNAKEPRLKDGEMSPVERMSLFNETLCKHMLTPFIANGADAVAHLKALCGFVLTFLESALEEEIPEEYGPGIGELMQLLKGLLYLLHPVLGFLQSARSDMEALKSAAASSKASAGYVHGVACQVLRTQFYKDLLQDATKRGSEEAAAAKEMTTLLARMGTEPSQSLLTAAIDRLPTFRAQLRQNAAGDLEKRIMSGINALVPKCEVAIIANGDDFDFKGFKALIGKYRQIFKLSPELQNLDQNMNERKSSLMNESTAQAVVSSCEKFLVDTNFDDQAMYVAIIAAVGDADGLTSETFPALADPSIMKVVESISSALPGLFAKDALQYATKTIKSLAAFAPGPSVKFLYHA